MYNDPAFQPDLNKRVTSDSLASYTTATEPFLFARMAQPTVKVGNTLILVPLGLIVLWTIALIWFKQQTDAFSRTDERKSLSQLPCRSCLFFQNNPYLKCAINPIDALTLKSIDCIEYTPHALPQSK